MTLKPFTSGIPCCVLTFWETEKFFVPPPDQAPPRPGTPPGPGIPWSRPPQTRHPPASRQLLLWTVDILLECILVCMSVCACVNLKLQNTIAAVLAIHLVVEYLLRFTILHEVTWCNLYVSVCLSVSVCVWAFRATEYCTAQKNLCFIVTLLGGYLLFKKNRCRWAEYKKVLL